MTFFSKIKGFHNIVAGVLLLFGGLMVIVTIAAYSRRSGNTGIDMAKIHLMRYVAQQETK